MKRSKPLFWAASLTLAMTSVVACGDDDDEGGSGGGDRSCTVMCEEAQAGDCTTISGDCSAFCAAVDSSKDAAGCTSEVDAYLSCQNRSDNVCDEPGCSSQETAVQNCYTPYCAANLSDPDCMTLINSF